MRKLFVIAAAMLTFFSATARKQYASVCLIQELNYKYCAYVDVFENDTIIEIARIDFTRVVEVYQKMSDMGWEPVSTVLPEGKYDMPELIFVREIEEPKKSPSTQKK